eukprot:1418708-Heterocapsa_arctica.AAC.1
MVKKAELRTLAAKAGWMAGVVPQMRPFVRQLWGALGSQTHVSDMVYRRQVQTPLQWLQRCFAGMHGDLVRISHAADAAAPGITIAVDGSPWGGGAVLWHGQVAP